jgi:hypothetical protein
MLMSSNEIWTVIHGMVFGAIFLLGFSAALYAVYSMKAEWMTAEGMTRAINNIKTFLWALAASVWGAVITGAYVVYPWYRAVAPKGTTDLSNFPKFLLLANPNTAAWHNFGMEWKEHVAFLAPMAATVVAFVVSYYGPQLAKKAGERRAVMLFFIFAFATAAAAGLFGAFITKAAPLH